MNRTRFDGRVPISATWDDGRPVIEWCYLGDRPFTEPFFEDTIRRALRHTDNLTRDVTPIDALRTWHDVQPGLAPTGFIFHMSRCGSTLVAQMLASLPQHIVISEAPPLDAILSLSQEIDDEQRIAWLRWMVSALGQPRRGGESRYFIKFDSWHVLHLPLIMRAFPEVPWIFLERSRAEVIASHKREPGMQMVPQLRPAEWFGIDSAFVRAGSEEYYDRVLSCMCDAAHAAMKTYGGRVIDYRYLPAAVWSILPAYWGFALTEEERATMMHVARFNAKTPSLYYEPSQPSA